MLSEWQDVLRLRATDYYHISAAATHHCSGGSGSRNYILSATSNDRREPRICRTVLSDAGRSWAWATDYRSRRLWHDIDRRGRCDTSSCCELDEGDWHGGRVAAFGRHCTHEPMTGSFAFGILKLRIIRQLRDHEDIRFTPEMAICF